MAMAVSNQQTRDAALLRATAELFVLDATHDRDELRRFEELATHFLGKVSAADRGFVAERISRHGDVPAAVLRLLGKDLIEIAGPILKRSPALTEFDMLAIMASTGTSHYRALASRKHLPPAVVAALRLTGDTEIIALVVEYPAIATELSVEPEAEPTSTIETNDVAVAEFEQTVMPVVETAASPTEPAPEPSIELAQPEPIIAPAKPAWKAEAREVYAVARAMTAALDAEMKTLADPMLSPLPARGPADAIVANSPTLPVTEPVVAQPSAALQESPETVAATAPSAERRAAAIDLPGIEAFLGLDADGRTALLSRLAGSPIAPRRATSIDADHAFRAALGSARTSLHARRKQREALIRALSDGLRLDVADVIALMDDPSGEALVLLLKAIGLSDAEAEQVLLFTNPTISDAVETFSRLAGLYSGTERAVAASLIDVWRSHEPRHASGHQPLFADMELRRSSHAETERGAASSEPGRASSVNRA
jgi:hypothetical protein